MNRPTTTHAPVSAASASRAPRRLAAALAFVGASLGGAALAHPPGPASESPAVGFSLGAGALDCDGSACVGGGALGGELHIGPKLRSDLILLGDGWLVSRDADRESLTQVFLTANIQWWPVERLWLRFGGGAAHADLERPAGVVGGPDNKSTWEPALVAGLGVELVSDPEFALDLQLLYGRGFDDDPELRLQTITVALGFNWY
ncbi:MAG: hypothetical protein U1F43_29930 [Myxococcota bacterium]